MPLRNTIIAMLWPFFNLSSQSTEITSLKIGDSVPDIKFPTMINHSSSSASLTDFKGKLIILDFWATWCIPCHRNFTKLDSLQKQFSNQIKILLVNSKGTNDNDSKIRSFYDKWEIQKGSKLNLPSVVNDTIANRFFFHRSLPHYVWISPGGEVIGITNSVEVNAENIKAILNEENISLKLKNDRVVNPVVFGTEDLPVDSLLCYTLFLKGFVEGLGIHKEFQTGAVNGKAMMNLTLWEMYETVVQKIRPDITKYQIIAEGEDSQKFYKPAFDRKIDADWYKANSYTLDMVLPVSEVSQLYKQTLKTLNMHSGLSGAFEKRKMKCWLLKRRIFTKLRKSEGGEPQNKLWIEHKPFLQNESVSALIKYLNVLPQLSYPVVDKTGYARNIDIEFQDGIHDIKSIQKQLKENGLKLKHAKRKMTVFVIMKKYHNSF